MNDQRKARTAWGAGAEPVQIPELNEFPDDARIWIFGTERDLNPAERDRLLARVDDFLAGWAAHGAPLRATRSWVHDRFLVVSADVRATHPSGCSIDALVRILATAEAELGVRFLGNETVWYRGPGGRIERSSRVGFRTLGRSGEIGPQTIVFDNSITALGEMRAGRWEGPARDRWHRSLLPRGSARD